MGLVHRLEKASDILHASRMEVPLSSEDLSTASSMDPLPQDSTSSVRILQVTEEQDSSGTWGWMADVVIIWATDDGSELREEATIPLALVLLRLAGHH